MTDIPVQYPQPMPEATLADGAGALPPIVQGPVQDTASAQPLLFSPVPAAPAPVLNVEQATPPWHTDPVKQGAAAGHVAVYAQKQGLDAAKQHWATVDALATAGKLDPEAGSLWSKFRTDPQSMKPDESANLLNIVSRIGTATQQSPDLQFDPVGRVASVGAGGEVRISYPVKTNVGGLSLQPLAPSAVERMRALGHLGAGATRDVPIQDLVAPYLGMETHEPTKEVGKLEEVLAGLADELGSTPERVRAQIAAGWRQMITPSEPWRKPFAVRAPGNEAEDALDDSLSQNLVEAMKAGVNSLDFTTHGEPAVTVQPEGGMAVSAPPTERNARLLRHLYPAFTKGGVTAWLPGEPAPTETASKIDGEVYNDFFLRQQGGHPLFRPGTHIVYDATDPGHPGEDLGPVLSNQPALSHERLRSFEIDPEKFPDLLHSHAWALLPGDNATKASLIKSGFHPISHKVGDTSQVMVFGITPEQARKFTAGEIVANDGTHSADGFRPGDGVSFQRPNDGQSSTTRLMGGDVNWSLGGVDRSEEPTDTPPAETTVQRARRRAIEVSAGLDTAIADIESKGGKNLRVYGHRNQLDGFQTAWEHVFTDGSNTTSVLTKSPTTAPNAGPVFVRSTDGMPETVTPPVTARRGSAGLIMNGVSVMTLDDVKKLTDVKAKGLRLDGDAIMPADDGGDVELRGGKIVVTDPTPPAARLVAKARATGLADSDFVLPGPGPLARSTTPTAVTISGDRVYPIKQTRPDPSWADRFGIVFDPGWRDQTGVQVLDPKLGNHLANTYETWKSQFGQAADVWDLGRIAVTSAYSKTPAYTEWGNLGGAIGLSAKHFQDPGALTDHVVALQAAGTIAPNVPPTPAYFLAHELGHVVHGALQFGTDGSGARQRLLTLRRSLGRDGIMKGLSNQAWHSPEEMVAEAVAESVLASNPRPLARQVTRIVLDAYSRVNESRTRTVW